MTITRIHLVDEVAGELRGELVRHVEISPATRLKLGPPERDRPAVLVGSTISPESIALKQVVGIVLLAPSLDERDKAQLVLAGREGIWLEIVADPAADLLAERALKCLLDITGPDPIGGSSAGLIGFRATGWRLASVLGALDASVYYWSPEHDRRTLEEERIHALRAGARRVEFDELLRQADVLIVDLPDDPGAEPLIGRAEFALMHSDALLVNMTSSTAIDDGALIQALRGDYLRGVALGRTNLEPLPADSPLHTFERVLLSAEGHTPDAGSVRHMLARRTAGVLASRPELGAVRRRVRRVTRRRQESAAPDGCEGKGR